MPSHLEINDVGAAQAAAKALASCGDQLGTVSPGSAPPTQLAPLERLPSDHSLQGGGPPEPAFGHDKFGAEMREKYPRDVAEECPRNKRMLAGVVSQIGQNVATAVAEYTGVDQDSARDLSRT